ncbi:ABC transporter substrate-binding protein [Taklimakanibacter deserti]|uniref:ABC transporter substrate-binding protein n=1 Tax=Taklimakanibacter deserti TaxID=2267839 RepID=UPI000E65D3DF
MKIKGHFDRRGFLQLSAFLSAGMVLPQRLSFAAEGDLLRIRSDSDINRLDPAFEIGNLEDITNRCVLVTLVRLSDMRKGNTIAPWGAEKIEQTDPTSITFTLLPGLKWTGGYGPVTPEDVKYSFERIADPKNESAWKYQFEKLDKVEVKDERTGIIRLKEPFQPIWVTSLPYYGGHIVCKAAVEKAGGKYTTEIPAQCGPYLLDKWEPKQKMTFKANPDWPGPKPDFGQVEISIVEDDQAAQLAYEAKAFDYCRVSASSAKGLKEKPLPDTKLIEAQSTRYVWLTINMDNPKLKDPKVRQAVQYAFDGEQLIAGTYEGLVPRSTGVVQPGTAFTRAKNIIDKPDYEKAKALLAEAGVSDLKLNLATLNDSRYMTACQIIQATMAQAGITIEIQPYDEGAYWVLGDKTQGDGYKNLELVLMPFAGGIDPSENLVWFRPDQIGVWNWSAFNSPEFEELYTKALSEGDQAKRKTMYNRMEDLMEESGGFIFVCHEPFVAIHKTTFEPEILADGYPNPVGFKKL